MYQINFRFDFNLVTYIFYIHEIKFKCYLISHIKKLNNFMGGIIMYDVGMYGGAFNPLHIKHVECIIKAATMCRELYIVISQAEKYETIDIRVKYRWIYRITKHLSNVKILILEDKTESKADYTEDLWDDDCRKVKEMIGKHIDAVFCGSDYDENSFWNKCYPDSEFIVFERDKYISSTAIRNDVYGHWDCLPLEVRPYFVKKVLLIGGESTGKSTLTINLAKYYNTNFLEEVGRELSELSGTDKMMLKEDYVKILLEHKDKELKLKESSNKLLFIDTDCLITKFYMEFLKDDGIEKNAVLADAIAKINDYDLILFLTPDVEFVQDGTRNEEIKNERKMYSDKIRKIYTESGFKYHVISGSYEERFLKAVDLIDNMLKPLEE